MRNRYCTKCGTAISSQLDNCVQCDAPVMEMKLSDGQKEFVKAIEEHNAENPPSKIKGCFAALIVFGIIFGIPAALAFTGTEIDSFWGLFITSILLIGGNILLFKYRRNMKYRHKRHYTLTKKSADYFDELESVCRKCNQVIEYDMTYCPNCGTYIHEDLPTDLSVKRNNTSCNNCGNDVTGKKFCIECGSKVEVF